jgi:molybdenum cofactor guanylyltransferase
MERSLVGGVFVGGASSRMGRPKGLLVAPEGRPLVERAVAILGGIGARVVLVGRATAYRGLDVPVVEDEPEGIGPLGGLVALLHAAGSGTAVALACDMPFVDEELLGRILDAPDAPVVAPRRDGRWEPLCARYDARSVLPQARAQVEAAIHSMQALLERCGAREIPLSPDDLSKLRDWDSPEDLLSDR